MSSVDFKPSDVVLAAGCPLVGTLGHAEMEHAALLIIRACQVLGDAWQDVTPKQIGEVLRADLDANVEPVASLSRNPFFRPMPGFRELVEKGFATCDLENNGPMQLADVALDRIAKRWVRRSEQAQEKP